MMIQNAPEGEKRFISTMAEHLDLCEQFGRAYGNDAFERPEPLIPPPPKPKEKSNG